MHRHGAWSDEADDDKVTSARSAGSVTTQCSNDIIRGSKYGHRCPRKYYFPSVSPRLLITAIYLIDIALLHSLRMSTETSICLQGWENCSERGTL